MRSGALILFACMAVAIASMVTEIEDQWAEETSSETMPKSAISSSWDSFIAEAEADYAPGAYLRMP